MNFLSSKEPIIACSSGGETNTGIAVIRLSGFDNLNFLSSVISLEVSSIKPRYAHFCKISVKNEVLDEIILTYFQGPNSFNGENILELSVHGNVFNIENIISLFIEKFNFRRAYPGEFSYRALRNKKLNLLQVEGLDLLLNASNPLSLKQGLSLLSGTLQKNYEDLLFDYKNHKSAIELSIDFLDDVGEEESRKQVYLSFKKLHKTIKKLHNKILSSQFDLINPEIVLVGQPNAGKSSLFNLFYQNERAIVSDIAGTTRDFISEKIRIKNNFFTLVDTAGLRITKDKIENLGIQKSYEVLDRAFFKILLINPFEYNLDFFRELDVSSFDLILFTHSDRKNFLTLSEKILGGMSLSGPIEPLSSFYNTSGPIEPFFKYNNGPIGASLKNSDSEVISLFLSDIVNEKYLSFSEKEPILISRHIDQIKLVYNMLDQYAGMLDRDEDISILSSEFNIVGHCISELIGIISPDEVLHNIFENFCIGK